MWAGVLKLSTEVHPAHKVRILADVNVGRGSGLVGICGPGQGAYVDQGAASSMTTFKPLREWSGLSIRMEFFGMGIPHLDEPAG